MNKDVFANSIADHDMIARLRKINNIRYNPKTIKYWNYRNNFPEELKSDVAKIDRSPVYDATNVDVAVQYVTSLQLVLETHEPNIGKCVKGKPCPWLDIDTKKLMNRRDQTFRKARSSTSIDDWKSYKTLSNKCNTKIKKAKSNQHKKPSMTILINQRNFSHKLKRFFLENRNQCQTYQLIKVLVWTYLVAFKVQWHQSWKNPLTYKFCLVLYSKISTKNYENSWISVLFVQKGLKLLSRQKSTGIDNWKTVVASHQNRCVT